MNDETILDAYIQRFDALRPNLNRDSGAHSPHKIIMLLTAMQLVENGEVTENRFEYLSRLLELYATFFEIARTKHDQPNPYFPFYHLLERGREPFWFPQPIPGREVHLEAMSSCSSHRLVTENISHVTLAPDLFQLLQNAAARTQLRDALIDRWLPAHKIALEKVFTDERDVESYRGQVEAAAGTAAAAATSVPVRNAAFARLVRDAYDYRCAATGTRVLLPDYHTALIEAAHLIPFSESQDDRSSNGMALTPNMHWALDRFIIAPDTDLKWRVSPILDRRIGDYGPFFDIDGQDVFLPRRDKDCPRQEALEWRMDHLLKAD
jgi:putative restriction endonuclease